MCRSAVDIHSATAEIRRGKKKEETTGQKYNLLICYTQGGHKKDRTEKSQKGYISPTWGEAPTEAIYIKNCVVSEVLDVITCAKFQSEIFRVTILQGGQIFHFPIDI